MAGTDVFGERAAPHHLGAQARTHAGTPPEHFGYLAAVAETGVSGARARMKSSGALVRTDDSGLLTHTGGFGTLQTMAPSGKQAQAEGSGASECLNASGALAHIAYAGTVAHTGSSSPPAQAEFLGVLAHDAFMRGAEALAAGDSTAALRWFGRAHRIAPEDLAGSLALAAAMLRAGDPAAADLFHTVADRADTVEAWLGLAAAHHARSSSANAAAALAQGLSRCVVPSSLHAEPLLTSVARAAGAPGWCCLTDDFRLHRHLLVDGALSVLVDGTALRGTKLPPTATSVALTLDGRHLLGSPLAAKRMRRVEGFVESRDGGVHGWAWHPASPATAPVLVIRPVAGGHALHVRAEAYAPDPDAALALHRIVCLPAAALAGMTGMLRVGSPYGENLLGSPLDPAVHATADCGATAAWDGAPPSAVAEPQRRVVVVIPVHRGLDVTLACIAAVEATVPDGTRIVVVDDATPEPALATALDGLRAARRIRLIRHRSNRGFPASANAGLKAALALSGRSDVVLLNSDARPTPGWLERLRASVHGACDIGTATPLSNDASILSYPHPDAPAPMPSVREARRTAWLAARANPSEVVDIPTAIGFCMYIRRECLAGVGLLREDVFAQGYGEENDFCLRARDRGWRHVAVPSAYVAHVGGHSFGAARAHLMRRNLAVLERLHPGYHARVAAFVALDPLAPARRRLDVLRFAQGRARGGAVVLVTHDSGGGVERAVRARAAAIRTEGRRPIVLRPVLDHCAPSDGDRRYLPGFCAVAEDLPAGFANLRYTLPGEHAALVDLLRRERPAWVEVHHMLGHHPSLLDLGSALDVPVDIHVHDYAWFCRRISLVNADRRYCGEPVEAAVCDACVAVAGSRIEEDISTASLRARSGRQLASARRVVVPSHDTARRIRRHFPATRPTVQAHDDDAPPGVTLRSPGAGRGERVVCVIGGIGVEKGYDVLLACALDAQARRLPLRFSVVGHTTDDTALFATGRVFVTGAYREDEAVGLIQAQAADIAFVPSIWPETWCYTLGLAWRAGLRTVAFNIGAPAERISRIGGGLLLPLGLPPNRINNALLAVPWVAGDECNALSTSSAAKVRA